jgi:undecaprenyl-diphosphatase
MGQWVEAAILGLLQGLTEFLPVSSSAHLRVAGAFLPSGEDPGAAFTAITQIGTELAVLLYFRRDIWRIVIAWLASVMGRPVTDRADVRLGWLVIVGSLPIVVLGLAFAPFIEGALRNMSRCRQRLSGHVDQARRIDGRVSIRRLIDRRGISRWPFC